jgi:D-sedoheptulose 7-phosphate isomerase
VRPGGFPIVIHSDIPRIQEVQASVYHIIREMLEVYIRGQG